MFEPLPDVIRLRRIERNLTLEKLGKLAGVSRRQLWLLEAGHNVSLLFLLKVANALELTELPIGNLRLRAAPPELGTLIIASGAMKTAAGLAEALDDARQSIDALVARALASVGSTQPVTDAAKRLEAMPAEERAEAGTTLRELATSSRPARAKRPKTSAKPAARRRAR